MYIIAKQKCSNTSHSLKAGDMVNMRGQDAQKLIDNEKAEKATGAQIKTFLAKKGGNKNG